MKNNILYIIIIILLGCTTTRAQDIPVMHFMHLNPYQLYTNPTAELPYNGYVDIPAISNLNVGIFNNFLRYNKLFEQNDEGYPTTITANKFVNSLAQNDNMLSAELNEEILGLGFRIKEKFFLSLDYRIRCNAEFAFSKDLLGFFVFGNMNYVGPDNAANLQLGIQANAYQEFSISFQHKVNDHWTWGIRPKFLLGLFNVQTQQLQASIQTNPEDYGMTVNYQAQARLSSFLPYTINLGNGDYSLEFDDIGLEDLGNAFSNMGGAIDVGLQYKPTPEIGLSLSVLDLGFIHWKTSNYQIYSELSDAGRYYENGSFVFQGLTNDDITQLTSEDGADAFLDTLADYFPLSSAPIQNYNTSLYTRVQAQFNYNITPSNRFSILAQGRFINHHIRPALTVAYNGSFFNIIDVCLAYTLQHKSYDNLAIGLGLNLGPINIYATTHNILPVISHNNFTKITGTLGIVINWGHLKKKEKIEA